MSSCQLAMVVNGIFKSPLNHNKQEHWSVFLFTNFPLPSSHFFPKFVSFIIFLFVCPYFHLIFVVYFSQAITKANTLFSNIIDKNRPKNMFTYKKKLKQELHHNTQSNSLARTEQIKHVSCY